MSELDVRQHYPIKLEGLPESWTAGAVGEFVDSAESGFACGRHSDEDIGVVHVRPYNIDRDGTIDLSTLKFVPSDYNPKRLRFGDVLFNNTNSPELIGKTAIIGKETEGLAFSNHMSALTFGNLIDPKFVAFQLHYLWFARYFLHRCVKHVNQASISTTELSQKIPLVVAPLNEQRRIVERIEILFAELDKGEESLQTAKARAGLYRQSLLKHAFEGHLTADWRAANPDKLEDPETLLTRIQNERDNRYKQALDDWQAALEEWRDEGEEGKKPAKPKRPAEISVDEFDPELLPDIPAGWALQHLGNLNVGVFDGPFGSNLKTSDYTDGGVQVIRLENIGYGSFITSKESYVSPEKYETIKKHTVYPRDIVFSSFVTDGIRSALVPSSVPFAVNKADCFAVQFFGATVSNEYVAHFLQSRWAYKAVEGLIHGVGRPRINTTQLKEIQVPICCPAEQDEIINQLAAKLSIIEASEKQMDEQLARSKALRQSILKRAFAGELVAQDPNDEPAAILLERIKAEKAEAEAAAKRDRKTKPVRKPKNRRPTMTDLIEVLKKEGDWVSASKAAQDLGIVDGTSSDDVEAFYRQLKERIEANEIEVERRGDEDWLRLAKVEAN